MFVAFAFSVMVLTTFSVSAFAYADDTEQMLCGHIVSGTIQRWDNICRMKQKKKSMVSI